MYRSDNLPSLGQCSGTHCPGNAKVRHFHGAFVGNQNVVGLDVPVHQIVSVGMT